MKRSIHIKGVLFLLIIGINFLSGCTKDPPPPVAAIKSFSPVNATTDDPVKIMGSNFTNATAVSFGGVAAKSFRVISDSVIFAYVNTGASGSISVSTTAGNNELAGFTYYTPQKVNLSGTCVYEVLGWPIGAAPAGPPVNGLDSGSITILQLNKYDSARNVFNDFYPPNPYTISVYADSASYVRFSGLINDPGPVGTSGASFVSFKASSPSVVYAKIVGSVITIPTQFFQYRSSSTISGSGTLLNGKLSLAYKFQYRGNIKTAILISY